jgi:hypothetical protein
VPTLARYRIFLGGLVLVVSAGCKSCEKSRDSDIDREGGDPEDQDDSRDNFWRARIAIIGSGNVRTESGVFDCTSTGTDLRGSCGPRLLRFKERQPPLMRATAARGWRFVRWEAAMVEPNGSTRSRSGPMPDGPLYLNGFGYADTGETETVTAVFVPTEPTPAPPLPHERL